MVQHFYHVTWVTHNSRVSDRMSDFLPDSMIKEMVPLVLNLSDQIRVAKLICESSKNYFLPIVTFNVLPDHIHILVVVVSDQELADKIGKIKGFIAHVLRKENKINTRIWARKFNSVLIKDENQLENVITYINNNHLKHESSWGRDRICGFGDQLDSLRKQFCINTQS